MNLRYIYRIIALYFFLFIQLVTFGQEVKLNLASYAKGLTNIHDGYFELGLVYYNPKMEIKPFVRIPISDIEKGIVQLDRSSTSFKAAIAYRYIVDLTKESGFSKRLNISLQIEMGTNGYTYYPDSVLTNELRVNRQSFSGEIIIAYYRTEGKSFAEQFAPEFRIRYSHDYDVGEELGTVIPNPNGISTIRNLIIAKPSATPKLSPAFAFNYYPGNGNISYTPALYFDYYGKEDGWSAFGGSSRIRIETWIFYYPLLDDITGVKIGISPFISFGARGSDLYKKVELGGMIQLRIGTNILNFL